MVMSGVRQVCQVCASEIQCSTCAQTLPSETGDDLQLARRQWAVLGILRALKPSESCQYSVYAFGLNLNFLTHLVETSLFNQCIAGLFVTSSCTSDYI